MGKDFPRKQLAPDVPGGGFGIVQAVAGQPLQLPGAREGILVPVVHSKILSRFKTGVWIKDGWNEKNG